MPATAAARVRPNAKPHLAYLLGTWFGCGRCPVAPGTAGSLAAIAIAWPLYAFLGWGHWHFLALGFACAGVGVIVAGRVGRHAGEKDPQFVVMDEVAGQWLALAAVGAFGWAYWLLAFAFFRLADIYKPFPIRQAEQLPGGWGVMADDVFAGLAAALVLSIPGWWKLV